MEFFQVVILAVLQGVTEFLPVSSSAHLILPSQLLGWQDQGLAFDVGVHVGTLSAVMFYFRKEIQQMLFAWGGSLTGRHTQDSRLAWLLIFATLPAVISGFLLNSFIDTHLRSILVIAGTTIIFGVLLGWADRKKDNLRPLGSIRLNDAFYIGLSQALALIPGTSRSGITITAALMLGFERQAAARFSFLLSIPVILGAGSLKGYELLSGSVEGRWSDVMAGTLIAAICAYSCIHLFLKWLDRVGMAPFVIYRLLLGMLLLLVWYAGFE